MAASRLQRLSTNQLNSSGRIINCFRKAQAPMPTPLAVTQVPQITEPIDYFSFVDRLRTEDMKGTRFSDSCFYPGFSFEFFLNPGPTIVPFRSELDNVTADDEDPRAIRADSVKKKRKKKMNKHKLRKLRKRLRRKT
ncbi:hypothetical protein F511_36852 [Dorcoceras hygrometricum]|uniref:Small ribosomal subunit protein mS38 n=1 Tax=Dorcoceras hygrometricum TaxID=472368 RepID=A0A2Z7BDN9_9LAMI|nr:hypothetical protein F511_36852 [Dorcoceras hygrometricum]